MFLLPDVIFEHVYTNKNGQTKNVSLTVYQIIQNIWLLLLKKKTNNFTKQIAYRNSSIKTSKP